MNNNYNLRERKPIGGLKNKSNNAIQKPPPTPGPTKVAAPVFSSPTPTQLTPTSNASTPISTESGQSSAKRQLILEEEELFRKETESFIQQPSSQVDPPQPRYRYLLQTVGGKLAYNDNLEIVGKNLF